MRPLETRKVRTGFRASSKRLDSFRGRVLHSHFGFDYTRRLGIRDFPEELASCAFVHGGPAERFRLTSPLIFPPYGVVLIALRID